MVNKKKRIIQQTVTEPTPVAIEEMPPRVSLRSSLDQIKTYEGVIGYILRNTTSAAIDLKDPARIVDYAILSSSAIDASRELAELFDLGEAKNIIIEGKNIRILSLVVDDNKVSVFMEKTADCERILRKLHAVSG